ncbi:MAG: T9SS type A sorting domain-containing protein [Bacteroidetes bacterium]|nr:T9SS type A sorting domain-containing protein [Bacteroidota bacterium]
MKKTILSVLSVLVMITIIASSNGKAGKTLSPGETSCTSCHSDFTINTGGGSVVINTSTIPVGGYIPGTTYSISVTVSKAAATIFGLGLEALTSANVNGGTLANITTATQIKMSGVKSNIVHNTDTGLSNASHTFTFNWTAPATSGVGSVTMYCCGLAGDNDGGTAGDYVYSTSVVIPEGVASNSLTTGTITGSPFCSGAVGINVPFTISGTYTVGNIFTAQLSNATGSFASPTTLGTLTGIVAGTIVTTTPLPAVAGTQYRIRVVGSAPVVTGADNGTNLTINVTPTVSASTSNSAICATSGALLTAAGATTYLWMPGNIAANPFTVTPAVTTTYTVTGTTAGCSGTATTTITVNPLPVVALNLTTIDTQCVAYSSIGLVGGTPAGGVFSGPGVTGNIFNPNAAGLGTWTITYTYSDVNGCANTATGTIFVDVCAGVQNAVNNESISVYPNPVNELLNVDASATNGITSAIIMNGLGQVVYSNENVLGKITIDMSNFANGIYSLQLKNGNSVITKKIVKQD